MECAATSSQAKNCGIPYSSLKPEGTQGSPYAKWTSDRKHPMWNRGHCYICGPQFVLISFCCFFSFKPKASELWLNSKARRLNQWSLICRTDWRITDILWFVQRGLNKHTQACFFKSHWELVLLWAPAGLCDWLELLHSHHAMHGGAPWSDWCLH